MSAEFLSMHKLLTSWQIGGNTRLGISQVNERDCAGIISPVTRYCLRQSHLLKPFLRRMTNVVKKSLSSRNSNLTYMLMAMTKTIRESSNARQRICACTSLYHVTQEATSFSQNPRFMHAVKVVQCWPSNTWKASTHCNMSTSPQSLSKR